MDKVQTCLQVLRKRISDGDLFLKGQMPSERRLTDELGVSRTTIRKALKILLDQGALERKGRRKARISATNSAKSRMPTIAFLVPAVFSSDHGLWWDGVVTALEGMDVVLRPISYVHFTDPTVHEAISNYDALFFIPPAQKIPAWLVHKMKESTCRIVVLDQDESAEGLLSVKLFPPASEVKLLEHLYALGHRRIDCLNTQGEDTVIHERMAAWQTFLKAKGIQGVLRSQPSDKPLSGAFEYVGKLLREGHLLGTVLFCTTGPCAVGAMRALKDAGLEVGVDVSVCAVNDEGIGRYLLKSLTALESLPRSHFVRPATEWMISGGAWRGPLLIQPDKVPLFKGESVGPAPKDGRKTVAGKRSEVKE
jgi:DNA-binding LacI/PurR family transcriptional regulator